MADKLVSEITIKEIDYLVWKIENRNEDKIFYHPTTNPSLAWPIIEREKISMIYDDEVGIWASEIVMNCDRFWFGETSLIAAMRCYVASVYGDSVEVSD